MFYGYFSVDNISNEKYGQSGLGLISFPNGYLKFDRISCTKSFQLICVLNKDKRISIKNPIENDFQLDFLCYDDLIAYLKYKDYFNKISLIICDVDGQEIYLHRDFFGISPLFYIHIPNKLIAFSSNLTSLLNLPSLRDYLEINKSKVVQYLTWLSDGNNYSPSTFFQNFFNVLPGQRLIITNKKKEIGSFIDIDPYKWSNIKTMEEFGDEFRNLFKKSVERDINDNCIISAQLSGGLDSSSICAMIRHLEPKIPIHTIYADTETVLTNEQQYSDLVAKQIQSSHDILKPATNSFEIANLHVSLYGQPEYMYNGSALNREIMQNAVSKGSTVLFSGHAGDAVVGYGQDYIAELFDEGKWDVLKKTISIPSQLMSNINAQEENPSFKILYSLLARKKKKLNFIELIKLVLNVSRFFEIPIHYFYKNAWRKIKDKYRIPSSIIKKDLLQHSDLIPQDSTSVRRPSLANYKDISTVDDVFTSQSIIINEQFFILDKYYGIQHKFPFYDKDLFELCMSVPSELKYDHGRQRGHFREAMKGILPEEVRNRTSKANFGDYGRRVIVKLYFDSLHLLNSDSDIWNYVDRNNFNKSVSLLLDDEEALYVYNRVMYFVSKTIYLAIWLSKIKNKSFINLN
ncbi:asparagine synthase-related protein [Dyadobacter subterraneus]|uniref:asparagine synthase (glutamine-hydrolyzing) n=1 Tax=Dyadobacter subterraneus TaxID=2773304 RepID=A0ABR9WLN0_9BACT|nr:asparagine synthase-related protein [Dyadobacter subterraneus]MBE9465079.1 hypothetical protein [Dyadobacter subterraneus]